VVPIKDGLPLGMKPPVMAKAFTWKKDVDELFFTEVTLLRCSTAKEGLYAFKPASHSPPRDNPSLVSVSSRTQTSSRATAA
jgi:hypothetical protein